MGYKVVVINAGKGHRADAEAAWVADALAAAGHETRVIPARADLRAEVAAARPDVAWVAGAEDGDVQRTLQKIGVPFCGSVAEALDAAADKAALEETLDAAVEENPVACRAPMGVTITRGQMDGAGAHELLDAVEDEVPGGYPVCVKPAHGCASAGVARVDSRAGLDGAVVAALDESDESDACIVQQWLEGVEMSVTILGEDDDVEPLPPVVPAAGHAFFDAAAWSGEAPAHLVAPVRPESLSPDAASAQAIRSEVERGALDAFLALGGRDLGRVDVIWDGGQARVLEADLSCDLAPGSRAAAAIAAAGMDPAAEVARLVENAVERGCEPSPTPDDRAKGASAEEQD